MNKSLLTLTAAALLLATTMGTAQAQSTDNDTTQRGQGMMQQGQDMMQQGQQGQRTMRQGRRDKQEYGRYRGDGYGWHHRRGMGPGMGYGMGHGMGWGMGPRMGYGMGPGMGWGMGDGMGRGRGGGMGHGAMMQIMFAMMDADGNGSLALQEVQDAHARIFAHMDANDDDQVTKGEIRAFFMAGKDRRSGRRNWSEMSDDMDDTDDADDLNLSDEAGDDDN